MWICGKGVFNPYYSAELFILIKHSKAVNKIGREEEASQVE
jgi:hypothetical protein